MYDRNGKGWFSWGRARRIIVCGGAVLRLLGSCLKMECLPTMLLTASATILDIDTVYDKCSKAELWTPGAVGTETGGTRVAPLPLLSRFAPAGIAPGRSGCRGSSVWTHPPGSWSSRRLLWTAVVAGWLITAIVLSVLAKRRQTASDAWNPAAAGFSVVAMGAVAGYGVAATIGGQFSPGSAVCSVLWPAMAGSALTYAAGKRARSWPHWASVAFSAAGAALCGSLSA